MCAKHTPTRDSSDFLTSYYIISKRFRQSQLGAAAEAGFVPPARCAVAPGGAVRAFQYFILPSRPTDSNAGTSHGMATLPALSAAGTIAGIERETDNEETTQPCGIE